MARAWVTGKEDYLSLDSYPTSSRNYTLDPALWCFSTSPSELLLIEDEIRRFSSPRFRGPKIRDLRVPKPIIKPEGYGTTTTYVPLYTASIESPAHAFPYVRTISKRGCNPIPIQVFSFNDSREEFLTTLFSATDQLSLAKETKLFSFTNTQSLGTSSHLIGCRPFLSEPWPQRKYPRDAINVSTDRFRA